MATLTPKVSRKGAKFVASFEGFRRCPYRNQDDVWTIGYGTTSGSGRNINGATSCISRKKARRWLRSDINKRYLPYVPRRNRMKQRELDALASFAYNLGPGAVSNSSSDLAVRLKSKEGRRYKNRKRIYREELKRWISPGSIYEEGLRKRREAETKLACTGEYDFL